MCLSGRCSMCTNASATPPPRPATSGPTILGRPLDVIRDILDEHDLIKDTTSYNRLVLEAQHEVATRKLREARQEMNRLNAEIAKLPRARHM